LNVSTDARWRLVSHCATVSSPAAFAILTFHRTLHAFNIPCILELDKDVPTHGQTTEELVPQRLGLGSSRETAELDLFGVELERVLGELETLLNQSLELADAATLVTENILGVGGTDDDLGTGVGDADFTARVTLGSELARAGN
jgi:hypothetical protein